MTTPTRSYSLTFDRAWHAPEPPGPLPPPVPTLAEIIWHGLELNAGHHDNGRCRGVSRQVDARRYRPIACGNVKITRLDRVDWDRNPRTPAAR